MEKEAYDEMRRLEDHHWWFRGKRRMVRAHLRRVLGPEVRTVLEVGCGTGANLAQVLAEAVDLVPASRLRVIGVDLEPAALRHSRARGLTAGLVRANGLRLPVRNGAVDALVALDFVEHVDDDGALLAEFARVVRPGGSLLASVPAYPWLWSPHDEFMHHRRRYRGGELEEKIEAAGFQLERHNGFNFLLLPPIALVRFLKNLRKRPEAPASDFFELPGPLNSLVAGLFIAEDLVTRVLPIPFGVSFLVTARRR